MSGQQSSSNSILTKFMSGGLFIIILLEKNLTGPEGVAGSRRLFSNKNDELHLFIINLLEKNLTRNVGQ